MTDASHLPPDHPAIPPRRIGVLLVNLGTPDATDYWSMRRYLKEFLSDRRVIEENRAQVVAGAQPHHPERAPGRKGRDYDKIWNKERNESMLRTITRSQSDKLGEALKDDPAPSGRLGHALRQSVDRVAARGAAAGRLRPHPDRAALSAIRRRDHGHGLRQGVRGARTHALAAGVARRPGLFRSAGLYRRDRHLARTGPGETAVQAGHDPRLVPRHAGGISAQGRSLLLPVRRDGAAAARAAQVRRQPADARPSSRASARPNGSSPTPTPR